VEDGIALLILQEETLMAFPLGSRRKQGCTTAHAPWLQLYFLSAYKSRLLTLLKK
jgi:hypothetical protein